MIRWKITLRRLREVKALLEIMRIEFIKIRRRPFILIATLAALLLPAPLSLLAAKTGQGYDFLYKSVINLGELMLLIPVICIVAAMLFFEERDNDTLKSLATVPVSMNQMAGTKLVILLFLSVCYSVLAFLTTVLFSKIGYIPVEHFMNKLLLCVAVGIMAWVAALPCIAFIVAANKNYILSILFSFLYAVMGFVVTNATIRIPAPNLLMILPVNVIYRWLLPIFDNLNTAKYPFNIVPSSVGTVFCILYLAVYMLVLGWVICKCFRRWNR